MLIPYGGDVSASVSVGRLLDPVIFQIELRRSDDRNDIKKRELPQSIAKIVLAEDN